jgi:hypothetical protein
VYVTVLLSQALAWNVEDVAHEAGYALAAILPFEGAAWAARVPPPPPVPPVPKPR